MGVLQVSSRCPSPQVEHLLTDSPFHSAFNNILSNLGYVMLGLLFLLIVLKRDIVHNRALVRNELNALVRRQDGAPVSRLSHLADIRALFPPGMWDPEALRSVLCHGHGPDDGGPAECLLPRLSQLHQLPVW